MFWAALIGKVVRPFRVLDALKIKARSYTKFLQDNLFLAWYRKQCPASFKSKKIFMQDNAPPHAAR